MVPFHEHLAEPREWSPGLTDRRVASPPLSDHAEIESMVAGSDSSNTVIREELLPFQHHPLAKF